MKERDRLMSGWLTVGKRLSKTRSLVRSAGAGWGWAELGYLIAPLPLRDIPSPSHPPPFHAQGPGIRKVPHLHQSGSRHRGDFFPGLWGTAAAAPGPVPAGGEPEAWPIGDKAKYRGHSVRKNGHWLCSRTTSEDQPPAHQNPHKYVGRTTGQPWDWPSLNGNLPLLPGLPSSTSSALRSHWKNEKKTCQELKIWGLKTWPDPCKLCETASPTTSQGCDFPHEKNKD